MEIKLKGIDTYYSIETDREIRELANLTHII